MIFHVTGKDCGPNMVSFTASHGTVFVLNSTDSSYRFPSGKCAFHIQVKAGLFINARVRIPVAEMRRHDCKQVLVYDSLPLDTEHEIAMFHCRVHSVPFLVSTSNHLYFKYVNLEYDIQLPFRFSVIFTATTNAFRRMMPVLYRTEFSGYITSPGFDGQTGLPRSVDIQEELSIPHGHIAMVSFPVFQPGDNFWEPCDVFLELTVSARSNNTTMLWKKCTDEKISPKLYNITRLILRLHTAKHWVLPMMRNPTNAGAGFKMLFSFHPTDAVPQMLSDGRFNCSVDHFSSFREHLDCNMEQECDNRQDETGQCPFSSPACGGKVASHNKCYFYIRVGRMSWNLAEDKCREHGGRLATIKTSQELLDAKQMPLLSKEEKIVVYVGMVFDGTRVPMMYRNIWRWTDSTIIYFMNHISIKLTTVIGDYDRDSGRRCMYYSRETDTFIVQMCYATTSGTTLCETELTPDHNQPQILLFSPKDTWLKFERMHAFDKCPKGHRTHIFLLCDPKSHCGAESYMLRCPFFIEPSKKTTKTDRTLWLSQFICEDDSITVHYTLVCDGYFDCKDQSDESFCQSSADGSFSCISGQCLTTKKRCDQLIDCIDESGEDGCPGSVDGYPHDHAIPSSFSSPPAVINFDGSGTFTSEKMNLNQSCPDTHYLCPTEMTFCLPVYTLCNGFYDCIRWEDEQGCDNITCPGFYRCRASTVCVHTDHLCDGWSQCPQHDDEWLCDTTCPAVCLCQGHAFLCHLPFPAQLFPQLRYLDASGSGMMPSDLSLSLHLVHLILRKCSLVQMTEMSCPNLQILDLRENKLEHVNISVFIGLKNLKVLRLSENPLKTMSGGHVHTHRNHMEVIDLSSTELTVFDGAVMSHFQNLRLLNISFTKIHSTGKRGFRDISHLIELDMRGSPIEHFHFDVYKGLHKLGVIFPPNHRLCCKQLLLDQAVTPKCITHQSQLSSCTNLLRSQTHRVYVWLTSMLAIIGNVVCLVRHCALHVDTGEGGFDVLFANLNVANLLLGVYLAMIGTGDVVSQGRYLYYQETWKNSASCCVAGFLFLLCGEASALILCLTTIDRVLIHRFPDRGFCFGRGSAILSSLLVWVLSCALASVPLLPATSHWKLYNRAGICNPLLAVRRQISGWTYAFGIFIVFNFVLFLAIIVMQAYIYLFVMRQRLEIQLDTSSNKLAVSRRLVAIAVTDCVGWFVYIISGLPSSTETTTVMEINMDLSVCIISINSMVNPFLYLLRTWLEKRQAEKQVKLLRLLKSCAEHMKAEDLTPR